MKTMRPTRWASLAAAWAVRAALVSTGFADHEQTFTSSDGSQHYKHYHNGVAVIDCTCHDKTSASAFSPADEMERPIVKGTARGGSLDLVRNTRPMFSDNWSRMVYPTEPENPGMGGVAYHDTSREDLSTSRSYDPTAAGSTAPTVGTQTSSDSSRSYRTESAANPTADSTVTTNPEISRERDLDRNRERAVQDAQHGFDSDKLNRDRLLYGETAPVTDPVRTPPVAVSETALTELLRTSISDDTSINPDAKNVRVTVSGDSITLHGTVASETEKKQIEMKAKALPGVRQINNELEVSH